MTLPAERKANMQTAQTALAELKREAHIRRSVYPRLIMAGKLSVEEADRRQQCLDHAITLLTAVAEAARRPYPHHAESAGTQPDDVERLELTHRPHHQE